jgi:hypothetical protein
VTGNYLTTPASYTNHTDKHHVLQYARFCHRKTRTILMQHADKPEKGDFEGPKIHKIRITLTSRNVKVRYILTPNNATI